MSESLGSTPIPGGNAAGENARYEAEYEAVTSEIGKLGDPAAEEIRWQDIVNNGEAVLGGKSKDLLIASYYSWALYQQQGLQGLLEGIKCISAMTTMYWDDMFPPVKRMRARESALDWLIDKVSDALEKTPPGNADEAAIAKECGEIWNELTNFVNPKLEAPNPKFDAMVRAFNAGAAGASSPEGGSGTAGTDSAGASTMVDSQPAGGGGGGAGGPITNRKVAFERLREVANFLDRTEPHTPVAHLVKRAIRWGDMSLEEVLKEVVKNNDARRNIFEALGVAEEK